MSDESIVTVVLPPTSAKYASARVPWPNVMAVALCNLQHETGQRKGVPNLTRDFLQKSFLLRSLAGKIRRSPRPNCHGARRPCSGIWIAAGSRIIASQDGLFRFAPRFRR